MKNYSINYNKGIESNSLLLITSNCNIFLSNDNTFYSLLLLLLLFIFEIINDIIFLYIQSLADVHNSFLLQDCFR